MFSMACLQPAQIRALKEEYHIYLLPSGRISMTGCSYKHFSTPPSPQANSHIVTEHNVEYVAQAFHNVIVAAKPE
jgi:aspartate aminotransferase